MSILKNRILVIVSLITFLFLYSGDLTGEENHTNNSYLYKPDIFSSVINQPKDAPSIKPEYIPGDLIVKFKPYTPKEDISISSYKEERDNLLNEQLASDSIKALEEKYGVTEVGKVFK